MSLFGLAMLLALGNGTASGVPASNASGSFDVFACLDSSPKPLTAGGSTFLVDSCQRRFERKLFSDGRGEAEIAFGVLVKGSCAVAADGFTQTPNQVVFRGGRGFEYVTRDSQVVCGNTLGTEFPEANFEGSRELLFTDARRRLRVWPWRLEMNGQVVARGQVRYSTQRLRRERSYDIFDTDIDRFINVCINGNHRLYSEGTRLYCTVVTPGVVRLAITLRGGRRGSI